MIVETSRRVTPENGPRPAGRPDECFYCGRLVGMDHAEDCVCFVRTVVVRATIEYVIRIPAFWTKDNLEFHRNEGTWCSSNGLDEINRLAQDDCLCGMMRYTYVAEADTAEGAIE